MDSSKEAVGSARAAVPRAVFAGGGTGGHLYPIVALANKMRAEGSEILFLGTRNGLEATVLPTMNYNIRFISSRGLAGSLRQKLAAVWAMGLGFFQSIAVLRSFRPSVVVGSGGYVCAPVLAAATLLRVPIVIMEQNAFAGKSVKLFGRFADKICVCFPGRFRGLPQEKLVLTGNPVRGDIASRDRAGARQRLKIAEGRFCLLITGASQGAQSINEAVLQALPAWKDLDITILHLTGPKHFESVTSKSREILGQGTSLDYRLVAYQQDMAEFYAAADMTVCRAGATTLAEITARGLPGIYVPYPFAAENHQEANARSMVSNGAGIMVLDKVVREELGPLLLDILQKPQDVAAMAKTSLALGRPKAADEALKVVHQVVDSHT